MRHPIEFKVDEIRRLRKLDGAASNKTSLICSLLPEAGANAVSSLQNDPNQTRVPCQITRNGSVLKEIHVSIPLGPMVRSERVTLMTSDNIPQEYERLVEESPGIRIRIVELES